MLICFLKRKMENWQIYGTFTILWYDNFGEKCVSAEEWHGCHSKNKKQKII